MKKPYFHFLRHPATARLADLCAFHGHVIIHSQTHLDIGFVITKASFLLHLLASDSVLSGFAGDFTAASQAGRKDRLVSC